MILQIQNVSNRLGPSLWPRLRYVNSKTYLQEKQSTLVRHMNKMTVLSVLLQTLDNNYEDNFPI